MKNLKKTQKYILPWTADDIGRAKCESHDNARAGQNIGKLNRDKVLVINQSGVDLPSDYAGVIYIPFNENWQHNLSKEILEIYK